MNKGETVGMQCLTPDILHVRVVQIISDKRKTNILHVHTDLVCASGFQKERDKAVSVSFSHDMIMCDSGLTALEVYFPSDKRSVRIGAGDGCIDCPCGGGDAPFDDRKIFPLDLVAESHAG